MTTIEQDTGHESRAWEPVLAGSPGHWVPGLGHLRHRAVAPCPTWTGSDGV
jgi:hypothetical protein